jgi:hypothetical protein
LKGEAAGPREPQADIGNYCTEKSGAADGRQATDKR